jgi:uncharacterized protein YggE
VLIDNVEKDVLEQELRKQIKQDALKAAREKAQYLLESIGKKAGDVITIKEVNGDHNYGYYGYYGSGSSASNLSNSALGTNGTYNGDEMGAETKKMGSVR